MLLGLCSAGPPREGVETTVGAGSGSFEYTSGCAGPRYANKAVEGHVFGSASYRHSTGLTGALDVAGSVAKTTESRLIDDGGEPDPPPQDEAELGRVQVAASASPRVGYHHDYFGLEAGGWGFFGVGEPLLLPAGQAWAGVPRYVYAWGSFLAGPTTLGHWPVEAGLGHDSDRLRLTGGLNLVEPAVVLDGDYRVEPERPLYIGGRLIQRLSDETRGTIASLTLSTTW